MKLIKLLLLLSCTTQIEAAQLAMLRAAARTRTPMCHRVALLSHHAKQSKALQDTLAKELNDIENAMRKTEMFSKEYNILSDNYWIVRDKLESEQRRRWLIKKDASDPDFIKFNNHVAKYAFFYRPFISFFAPSELERFNEIIDNHKQSNK